MHLPGLVSRVRMRVVLNMLFVLAILIALIASYTLSQGLARSAGPTQSLSANQAFDQAAQEFHVPVSLLKAICYIEGRLSDNGGSPSVDNGFGCMHLVKNSHADTLDQAAQKLGVSISQLQKDLATNIRGGAAILRDVALQVSSTQTLPVSLAGWYGAVAAYSHATLYSTSLMYADAVYKLLNQGFQAQTDQGETVTLAPQAVKPLTTSAPRLHAAITPTSLPAGCTNDTNVDYPGAIDCVLPPSTYDCNITPTSACSFTGSNRTNDASSNCTINTPPDQSIIQACQIDQIVIHDTEGSATSALDVFQDPANAASAHYLVDTDGTIYQIIREHDIAYHVGNFWYNTHSIGIEHVGFDQQGYQWYNATMYLASAKLVAYLLQKYHLPLDRSHVVAHGTVPSPSLAASPNHVDPGPYWLWDYYFSLISQQGVALNTRLLPDTITLHPQNNQSLSGPPGPNGQEGTSQDYNFFPLYTGPSTKSGIIPQQGNNDPIDVSYNIEPGVSYFYIARAPDAAGAGDTMYEIWYGIEDQVHTSQHSYFADGKLAWLAVPPGAGVEGPAQKPSGILYARGYAPFVILSSAGGAQPIYGRPTSDKQYIIGNAPGGAIFASGMTVIEDGSKNLWFEISYNHRQAWIPAIENTLSHLF
ncbi:MAG TPA: N-acetylmuramoyl-L-alanine amidase [Ktedonobacteraceae bacterium]|nr:N-acetylmuramoyl-L-alanine amidase [Ktedonobacteraceae bacterium]